MKKILLPAMTLGLVAIANAQTTVTFPNTLPASYAGNSWPFNNTANGFRCQFIYDGSMLGVNYPVLIQRLRFRRSSLTATTTGSHTNVTCSLSTSPVKWNALTTTFNNHVGKDVQKIFSGTLQMNATAWYVDIKLTTPFLYDPSKGDLCFDFLRATGATVTRPGSGGYHPYTAPALPSTHPPSSVTACNGRTATISADWY